MANRVPGHAIYSEAERGPKGHRLAVTFCDQPCGPRGGLHRRTWKSRWYNTGHKGRDCYLAHMELQRRVAELHREFSEGFDGFTDAEINAEFKQRNQPPPNPEAPTMKAKR